jgi:hypothetical protein
MRKILLRAKFVFLSLLAALALSCSVEDGVQGPEGPPGPQGAQGAQGVQGPAGANGNSGVTTVLFENQLLQGGESGIIEFDIPELTQSIFDNGMVYAYISQDPTQWLPLPFSLIQEVSSSEGTTLASTIVIEIVGIEVGKVALFYLLDDLTFNIKFVLVDGVSSNASAMADIESFL